MSVLSAVSEQQLQDVLVSSGMLDAGKLEKARKAAKDKKEPLFGYLIKNKLISDEQLTKANATVTKVPYVNLTKARVDPKVLQLLPQDIAERYMAVPLGEMQHRLVVAMLDAGNVQAVDFLSNRIGRPLKVYVASEAGIRQVLRQYSTRLDTQNMKAELEENVEEIDSDTPQDKSKTPRKDDKNIKTIVQDSPISKALSAILEFAARNRASDVHIEPLEHELKIRCRVDGVLREIMRLPKNTEPAMISRVKILSNLKIDEHRTPAGRWLHGTGRQKAH